MKGKAVWIGSTLALLVSAWGVPRLEAAEPADPVIDLHVDLPYRAGYKGKSFEQGSGEFRAEDLIASGVSGVVLPLFIPTQAVPEGRSRSEFERSYSRVFTSILQTPPYSLPGCRVGRAGGSSRRVSTWLSFEGADPVEPSHEELSQWSLRGVRLFGLVHSEHNALATSSGQPSTGKGLTDRGRLFAGHVLRLGGILDVSHASDEATDDLIRMALHEKAPIVASHSNARALAPHPRNLTDAQIRGIARSGGVIGVNFHKRFLQPRTNEASMEDVVEQVRYIAKIGGVGTVAIGSDFEGGIRAADGLANARRYQSLSRALGAAGFSAAERRLVMGGNALRVLCAAEKFVRNPAP